MSVVPDREVMRWRYVTIDLGLLTMAADLPPGASGPGQLITLNLFDGLSFVAEAATVARSERGVVWIGRLQGVEGGEVVMVVSDTIVAGNITLPGGRYHIRYAGGGLHAVQMIDQSLFPPDEPFVPTPAGKQKAPLAPSRQADALPALQGDACNSIDVMVVYTATTRAAAGGTAAIKALIDLAIAETNQSYLNSGVSQRLRLVHTEEVAYTESGNIATDLYCITDPVGNGCIGLDTVQAARDTYGADLVSFWEENGGGYCGVGFLMDPVSSGFESYGYSVTARSCATGYYSFGHELGHNMGARHDTYVDSATTPYAYAHGYAYPAAASPWRTVMAYNNACSAVGKSCTRVQYWSNPGVSYGGIPMGDVSTADDHLALNNTACTVANFRSDTILPNLTPTAIAGWSDKIVVSNTTGTNSDSSPLNAGDTLYVDWAVINNGLAATTTTFYTKLFVDEVERNSWPVSGLNVNATATVTDYAIGSLSAGQHTIRITTDATALVSESNETDNAYSRTISVFGPPAVTTGPASAITATGATLNGTATANGISTTVTFEYGFTTGYGSTAPAVENPIAGFTGTAVTAAISGLEPGALYHYRAKGVNSSGPGTGSDQTFTAACQLVMMGSTSYPSIQNAFNAAVRDSVIRAAQNTFSENLTFAKSWPVTLDGGYDCASTVNPGYTTLSGSLTVTGAGPLTIAGLVIQ
jgi:hypothetical protein